MTDSAQGVDVSAYQQPVDEEMLSGLHFAFCKATNGVTGVDPHFAANWSAIGSARIWRGAYHEFTADDPVAQAEHFVATVAAQGLKPGDMLAVSLSDYAGVTGAQAKAFLGKTAELAGPRSPVLAYSDLSSLAGLADCAGYPLWIAWFEPAAPASVAPWDGWTFWQWRDGGGTDGGDADAFNGTAEQLGTWIASYVKKQPPVPPAWEDPFLKRLPLVISGFPGAETVRTVQGLLCARGHAVTVNGTFDLETLAAVEAFQTARGLYPDGKVGPLTWAALLAV